MWLKLNKGKFLQRFLRILSFSLLTVWLMGIVLKSQLFNFQSFSCKSQFGPCSRQEEEKIEAFLGQNIIFLNTSQVKGAFRQDFMIRDVFVQKVIPNKLSVFLEKRKPIVAVTVADSGQNGVFLVSREGVVLEFVENSALPQLQVKQGVHLVVGEKVSEEIVSACKILYLTYRLNPEGTRIRAEVSDKELLIGLQDSIVRYPLDKDPQVLVGALQLILVRSRIDGKLPKSIDLRYSNPVLVF